MTKNTKYLAEYVWVGGGGELRSKTRVLSKDINDGELIGLEDLPYWNYDGSSTGQATTENSEVGLKPVAVFKDPLTKFNTHNVLVMCETYLPDMVTPHPSNKRYNACHIFDNNFNINKPLFGLEQEYFIFDPNTRMPLGFSQGKQLRSQGPYYCSVGASNSFGRKVALEHIEACLYAGISITGLNLEVCCGQLEFQICDYGINAGDHLWMARYILQRIAENHGYDVSFEPKPVKGDWNGSGCHVNFSTKKMMENGTGILYVENAIEKLAKRHSEHMEVYGVGNHERLTGKHETSNYNNFTVGKGNRGASVRIPNTVIYNRAGYFEDRRPGANMDPWLVCSKIYETCCLLP